MKDNLENLEPLPWTGERYLPDQHGSIELEHLHRYLQASEIAHNKVVLDIASGEGYGTSLLAKVATRAIGVDISEEAVNYAKEKYKKDNLEYLLGDCTNIPLPDSSVDLVVSFETIEHHDQHEQMMREIRRVLRPNGSLLISSPDRYNYSIAQNYINPYHVKELFFDEFKALLLHYFKSVEFFGQRVVYGSVIFSEFQSSPISSYSKESDRIDRASGLGRPTYWIAIASNEDILQLSSGILEENIAESDIARILHAEIANREGQVANLGQVVAEREGQIASLGQVVAERDGQIASLGQAMAERDGQIAALVAMRERYQSSRSCRLRRLLAIMKWRRALAQSPLFDSEWYLQSYPDVASAGLDPLKHYLTSGWGERRRPGPEFDNAYYVARYQDIEHLDMPPLVHYWLYGRFEGRYINAAFDVDWRPAGAIIDRGASSAVDVAIDAARHAPLISVIIPTYNRIKLLPDVVDSWREVHAYTKIPYEIIFSDDGSEDGSAEFLESIGDLPIKVLRNAHGGASSARNAAIRFATGERLLIIGDDIFPDPEILNVHAQLGAELGDMVATLGTVDWHEDLPINHLMHHITEVGNEQFSYNRLQDGAYVDFRHFYTCNICVPRHFFAAEQVVFDERFNEYGFEDIELGYRLALRGLKIYFTTAATGEHFHPYNTAQLLSPTDIRRAHGSRFRQDAPWCAAADRYHR